MNSSIIRLDDQVVCKAVTIEICKADFRAWETEAWSNDHRWNLPVRKVARTQIEVRLDLALVTNHQIVGATISVHVSDPDGAPVGPYHVCNVIVAAPAWEVVGIVICCDPAHFVDDQVVRVAITVDVCKYHILARCSWVRGLAGSYVIPLRPRCWAFIEIYINGSVQTDHNIICKSIAVDIGKSYCVSGIRA